MWPKSSQIGCQTAEKLRGSLTADVEGNPERPLNQRRERELRQRCKLSRGRQSFREPSDPSRVRSAVANRASENWLSDLLVFGEADDSHVLVAWFSESDKPS